MHTSGETACLGAVRHLSMIGWFFRCCQLLHYVRLRAAFEHEGSDGRRACSQAVFEGSVSAVSTAQTNNAYGMVYLSQLDVFFLFVHSMFEFCSLP